MANAIEFESFRPTPPDCVHCEELLADAVDEVLSPGDQLFFDRHVASCTDCLAALSEARRGAAWLAILKLPRPEPSAQLLERILAQTSGAQTFGIETASHGAALPTTEPAPAYAAGTMLPSVYPTKILPFRPRAPFWGGVNRLLFEPRLAMTAAMAFFSVALTLNLTGVRLDQLHARNLRPAALRRGYYEATASVARRYEGLSVVHTLESRVDDLRQHEQEDGDVPDARTDRLEGMRPGGNRERPSSHHQPAQNTAPAPSPESEPAPSAPQRKALEPKPDHQSRSRQTGPHLLSVLNHKPGNTLNQPKQGGLA